jgi:hypothetical protein
MTMGLYTQPGVYQASWIEMRSDVAMSYEVDHLNETATLRFGTRDEYALTIGRDNLDQMLELAGAAKRELADPPAGDL